MKVDTLPPQTLSLFEAYQHLPGINRNTPYYINRSKQHFQSPVAVGKGTPEEIARALQNAGYNKDEDNEAFQSFCKEKKIGVDCSGLVAHLLDQWIKEQKDSSFELRNYMKVEGGVLRHIAYKLRPLANLNANSLTSAKNTFPIKTVREIHIGDLIRFSGGAHVGLISRLVYNGNVLQEVHFVHATEGSGVVEDTIMIHDPQKGLEAQEWVPNPTAKRQPEYLYRRRINKNGIRRLNLFM